MYEYVYFEVSSGTHLIRGDFTSNRKIANNRKNMQRRHLENVKICISNNSTCCVFLISKNLPHLSEYYR